MVCARPKGALRVWVFLLLLVAGPAAGWAQQPPTFELPEVTVPGRRPQPAASTPASVTVITRDELEALGVRSLGEALALLSELTVRAYGGLGALSTVSIRGASSLGVLVLVDGVPLHDLVVGQTDLSTIPLARVERVEVLRGPFSAIYGSGAVGGVVNVVLHADPAPEIAATAGAFGTVEAAAQISTGGRVRWTASAAHRQTAGYRINSDYRGTTFALTLRTGTPGSQMEFGVQRYDDDQGVPGSLTFATPQARQTRARTVWSAGWRGGTGDAVSVRASLVDEHLRFADPSFGLDSRDAMTTWRWDAQRVTSTRDATLTLGVEAQFPRLVSSTYGTRQDVIGAGYLQYDHRVGDRMLVSLGIRYDTHSRFGGQVNPRAGVLWALDGRTSLRATAGRTFRVPTYGELYDPFLGNPGLRPERAWSVEAGIDHRLSSALVGRIVGFVTFADDLIRPDDSFVPQNVWGRVSGISAELDGAAGAHRLRFTYTYLVPVDLSRQRDFLYEPRHRANLTWIAPVGERTTLGVAVVYVGERFADQANTVRLPAYVTVNAAVRHRLASGAVTLKVENLFDAAYQPISGYPAPGRAVFVSFASSW